MAHGGDNEAIPRQEKEERNPSLIASGNYCYYYYYMNNICFRQAKRLRELCSDGRPLADGSDNEAILRQEKEERNPSLIASGN